MPSPARLSTAAAKYGRYLLSYLGFLLLALLQDPGRTAADTKHDLTANPLGFLSRATSLWDAQAPMGQLQNQAYGYLFPQGPFFALGHILHLPGWLTQRLWWALLLWVGFWGVMALAQALHVGGPRSRTAGALVYVLSPRVLTTLGAISSESLPYLLAPWVLVPVVRALDSTRTLTKPQLRHAALLSAVAVAGMGAINATATLAAVSVSILWWLMHRPSRRWGYFTGWWLAGGVLACAWWVGPLLMLGRYSPPFLDYIESAQVTTRWANLAETLRGTTSWTPYLSAERVAGEALVTQPALIIATALVAAAGLAGLTLRTMPQRARLITIALVGITFLCAGWVGTLGLPFAPQVRSVLDGAGAAFRNVHKFEPLLRLPLALGFAHLLSRVPVRSWADIAHPERQPRVAAGMVLVAALVVAISPAWSLRLAPQGTYRAVPDYWQEAAQWLAAHAPHPASSGSGTAAHSAAHTPLSGSPAPLPTARALVLPGANFASQLWGLTRDEPLQPLARTPWAVRDAIPLVPPNTIRAMDAVEQLVADGRPAAGLAATLAGQGIRYLVVRNDLNLAVSNAPSPLLVHRTVQHSPGLRLVAHFGPPTRAGASLSYHDDTTRQPTRSLTSAERDLYPEYPAIEIYEVTAPSATSTPFPFGGPWLVDTDTLPLVVGGPEALSPLNDLASHFGEHSPTVRLLEGHAAQLHQQTVTQQTVTQQPRWAGFTITDSPKAREVDFGRVDHHSSDIRSLDETRHTGNRQPDYPTDAAPLVYSRWYGGRVAVSSSTGNADHLGAVQPGAGPAAAFDGDPATSWRSALPGAAVGQSLTVRLDKPLDRGSVTVTVPRGLPGSSVNRLILHTNAGSAIVSTTPGKRTTIPLPPGTTRWLRISAGSTVDGSAGVQFGLSEVVVRDTSAPSASSLGTVVQIGCDVVVGYPAQTDSLPPLFGWTLHQDFPGAVPCAEGPQGRVCDPALAQPAEEPGTLRRTITTLQEVEVTPRMLVRLDSAARAGASISAGDRRVGEVELPHTPPHVLPHAPGGASPAEATSPVSPGSAPSSPVSQGIPMCLVGNPASLARALQRGEAVPAVACRPTSVRLPAGEVRVAARAGKNLVVDTLQLLTPAGQQYVSATANYQSRQHTTGTPDPAGQSGGSNRQTGGPEFAAPPVIEWGNSVRRIDLTPSQRTRLLVVPESVNPGWQATLSDGRTLTPTTANGWQQAWLVPAGAKGTLTLRFTPNTPYRIALGVGGAMVLLLCALTLASTMRLRRTPASVSTNSTTQPALTAQPYPSLGDATRRPWATYLTAAGTTLSGLLLAAHPWSLAGGYAYAGDHWLTQACGLVAVLALAAAACPYPAGWRRSAAALRARLPFSSRDTTSSRVTPPSRDVPAPRARLRPSQARSHRRNGSSTSA